MNVTAESYGHAVMLILKGELGSDSVAAFLQAVDHQLRDEAVIDIVLNMEEVPFIDSVALESLLELQDKLAERFGQVKLAKIDENIRKILEITRLDSSFEIFTDISDAVKVVQA